MTSIDVYANLNKDTLSVRSRESEDYGKVIAHKDSIVVRDVDFVVQPAGLERARETGTKNVHAFVRGEWDETKKVHYGEMISYNPYEYDSFVDSDERPVESAERVLVTTKGIFAEGIKYTDD